MEQNTKNKLYSEVDLETFNPSNLENLRKLYKNVDDTELNADVVKNFYESGTYIQMPLMLKNIEKGSLEFFLTNIETVLHFPISVKEIQKDDKNIKQYSVQVFEDLEVIIGNGLEMKDYNVFVTELTYAIAREVFGSPKKYYSKQKIEEIDFNTLVLVNFFGLREVQDADISKVLESGYIAIVKVKGQESNQIDEYFVLISGIDNKYVYKINMQVSIDGNAVAYIGNGYIDFIVVEIGNVGKGMKETFDSNLRMVISLMENMSPIEKAEEKSDVVAKSEVTDQNANYEELKKRLNLGADSSQAA